MAHGPLSSADVIQPESGRRRATSMAQARELNGHPVSRMLPSFSSTDAPSAAVCRAKAVSTNGAVWHLRKCRGV